MPSPKPPFMRVPVDAGPSSPDRRTLRILVGKPGLDGHDRGAKVVARALAEAGYEVIYTGLHQTPEMIAATAVQESVDAVGLSIMSGAHMTLFPAVLAALAARGAADIAVFGGGIVPKDDAAALAAMGVGAIFTPGASTRDIIDWIERELRPRVAPIGAGLASADRAGPAGADHPAGGEDGETS